MKAPREDRSGDDFVRAMEPIARELLGTPTKVDRRKGELLFGNHQGLSVDLNKGVWFDFEHNKGGNLLALIQWKKNLDHAGALAWMVDRGYLQRERPSRANARIAATYDYHQADGRLLFQVVRYEPKSFRQRQKGADGKWVYSTKGLQLVLYRLPQVLAAVAAGEIVYIVEGEKAADRLVELGLCATCSPGGANKWRSHYGEALAGADVVILPDNDPQAAQADGTLLWHPDGRPVRTGQDHADNVAKQLSGVAARLRIVALPDLPPKGDAFDWVASGGTAAALQAYVDATPPWQASHPSKPERALSSPPDGDDDSPSWHKQLQRDERNQVIANLANALTVLRSAPEIQGRFAYDQMLQQPQICGSIPGCLMPLHIENRPAKDVDISVVQEWLQRQGLPRVSKETSHQAVDLVAQENAYHPIRRSLDGLRWDGVERVDRALTYYFGVEPSPYVTAVSRWFLISMVARIMQPGCQVDHVLVLEGGQGVRKSSACRILAGEHFSDSLPPLNTNDQVRLAMHLRGKWLIGIPEMTSISKADTGTYKAFLTQREERYTPKYGRNEVIEPRQCVFIGTTNKITYLRDETGGRRFWPVVVTNIDIEALAHDRDQIFAEARALYDRREPWWPDSEFQRDHIDPEQETRYEADAWETTINDWLAPSERKKCTLLEIAREALFIDTGKFGTKEQRRVAEVLQRAGWVRNRTGLKRWWERSNATD